ncbi:5' nucleotidase, NT5C type [Alicyclobacillus cycloheptanicus]|uniref:5'(3')-deoxyribonucleotidase n=1 Tax=Alicyclobacillus cycloheptanicus TaxID=1457 RepID=A0ABT9XKS7_9BACL|nr:5'-3'-deoxyribonucleotidase [Alicyclobacillus cycloheptanicus]MDQ0190654.1 5'(3')-deoxyribonucleotidase [Alicyclobacillus cycloheptanicus]
MKRIAIDMDDTIADFTSKHLRVYNEVFNESLTVEDLNGKKLWHARPHKAKEILDLLADPEFFRDLEVIEGSQEIIALLNEQYEVYIATAAMDIPHSFSAKYEWLRENFPFLSEQRFVFCGNKTIVNADYLIDDSPRHFVRFPGQGILFTAHHNLDQTGYPRFNSWEEAKEYFF